MANKPTKDTEVKPDAEIQTEEPKPKIVLAKPVQTEAPKAEPPNLMRIRKIQF